MTPQRKVPPCVPAILNSNEYKNPTFLAHLLAALGGSRDVLIQELLQRGATINLELYNSINNITPRYDCPAVRSKFGSAVCDSCPLLRGNLLAITTMIRRVVKTGQHLIVELIIDDTPRTLQLPVSSILATISAVYSGSEKKMNGEARWAALLYAFVYGAPPYIITHQDAYDLAQYLLSSAQFAAETTEIVDAFIEFVSDTVQHEVFLRDLPPSFVPPLLVDEKGIYFRVDAFRSFLRAMDVHPSSRSLLGELGSLIERSVRVSIPDEGFRRYYFVPLSEIERIDRGLAATIRKKVAELREALTPAVVPRGAQAQKRNERPAEPAEQKEVETYEV